MARQDQEANAYEPIMDSFKRRQILWIKKAHFELGTLLISTFICRFWQLLFSFASPESWRIYTKSCSEGSCFMEYDVSTFLGQCREPDFLTLNMKTEHLWKQLGSHKLHVKCSIFSLLDMKSSLPHVR
jgi:hypothetical protein